MKSSSGQISPSQPGIVIGSSSNVVFVKSKPSIVLTLRYQTLTKWLLKEVGNICSYIHVSFI